jgi:hypothetical protein
VLLLPEVGGVEPASVGGVDDAPDVLGSALGAGAPLAPAAGSLDGMLAAGASLLGAGVSAAGAGVSLDVAGALMVAPVGVAWAPAHQSRLARSCGEAAR